MKFLLILYLIFLSSVSFAELLYPSPNLQPDEVISIQLNALKNNKHPHLNAGIEQTWEFAHPLNRKYTGPLKNFIDLMYSPFYVMMIDHKDHNILLVSNEDNIAYFFIELTDKIGNEFGFQWIIEKVATKGKFNDCWMTTSVSQPMLLAKST